MKDALTYKSRRTPRCWLVSLSLHALLVFSLGFVAFSVTPVSDDVTFVWTTQFDPPTPNCLDPRKVLADAEPSALAIAPSELPKWIPASLDYFNHAGPEESTGTSAVDSDPMNSFADVNAINLVGDGSNWYEAFRATSAESGGDLGISDPEPGVPVPSAIDLKTERSCIESGLTWLENNQEKDGHWERNPGIASDRGSYEVTALALLALSRRKALYPTEYNSSVKRAAHWLSDRSERVVFTKTAMPRTLAEADILYSLGTLALFESTRLFRNPDSRADLRTILRTCIRIHNDASDQGPLTNRWYALALKSAIITHGCDAVLADALLPELPDSGTLLAYENDCHLKTIQPIERWFCPGFSHCEGCRFCGRYTPSRIYYLSRLHRGDTPAMRTEKARGFIQFNGLPNWDPSGATVDISSWFDGSLLAAEADGDNCRMWREHLLASLIAHQEKTYNLGSWPPVGPLAGRLGRTGQTALACLSLSIFPSHWIPHTVWRPTPPAPASRPGL